PAFGGGQAALHASGSWTWPPKWTVCGVRKTGCDWVAILKAAPTLGFAVNLPRRLSAHVAAIAAYQEQRASADRKCLVCRTTADRLQRRNADPRLQRDSSLLSEQTGPNHVHDRSRGCAR